MSQPDKPKPKDAKAREAKLAAALRANLRRRKTDARSASSRPRAAETTEET